MNPKSHLSSIDLQSLMDAIPGNHIFLLPDAPEFTILGATDSFLEISCTTRDQILGKPHFTVFTDSPANERATGVVKLRASLKHVLEYKREHRMAHQRYDIVNPKSGQFEKKVWAPSNKPVLDVNGNIVCIIHTTEEISEKIRLTEENHMKDEKLNESELRFRSIVEQAPLPILLSRGEDVVIESLNAPMLKAINKTSFEEVLGKKVVDVMPELKGQEVLKIVKDVQRTGMPFSGEEMQADVLIDNNLQRFYFNFSYTPIIQAGEITGVLHTALNITQQVLARKKVEAAKQELQFVMDTVPQLVWGAEATGDSFFFNKGWLDYTGLTLDDVKGNGWTQSLHPDDLDRTLEAWTHAYKDGALYEIEYRLKRSDGQYRWFLTRGTPMKANDGTIIKWYGTTTDVNDQKLAEESLRESEARFRLMVNAVPQSIWITDAEGRTEFLNKHWCDYCGEPYTETTAADIAVKYLHPEDGPKVMAAFKKAMSTGEPFEVEQRNRSSAGEYRWFLNRATPYRDQQTTNITKWVGVGIDIHDRKLAEDALRKSEEALERKVAERTTELEPSNQELKRSNQNLEEFAYAASHDLKEPVRKIHLFTQQLKDQLSIYLQEGHTRAFTRIVNATERMRNLIDDLLLYSHVSQQPHDKENIDLNQKVRHVMEDLELDIQERGAIITVGELPVVSGYRRQLQQLFTNLITNALKYSNAGVAPRIDINAELTTVKGSPYHKICIKDNGIGFEQEYADKIFQMFTRLHNKNEYSGTGVGLSIVKKVVENHKGFIKVESAPQKGSAFTVYLPC